MADKRQGSKCHHCMFLRMTEGARAKIARLEAEGSPAGMVNPTKYVLMEFEALLNDQPKCTCGQPADKKWTRPSGSSL